MLRQATSKALITVLASLLLIACTDDSSDRARHAPVPIAAGDECHVCGMIIENYPGPKGEVFARDRDEALKFCSTRDLFAYLLEPGSMAQADAVFVHDMAVTDWDHPADNAFVSALDAWYVIGHRLRGAMGPTLASFSRHEDAQGFVEQHGGRVLRFDDVTLEIISDLEVDGPPERN